MHLSVGQASGLIALAVLMTSLQGPLLVEAYKLRGYPQYYVRTQHRPATSQQKSPFFSLISTLSVLLLAITGILTPLGLTEAITTGGTKSPNFRYVSDQSAFGYGTPPRYEKFARVCGLDPILVNCPGRTEGVNRLRTINQSIEIQETHAESYFNTSIPQNLTSIFSSATAGTTLSGAFDIQYRTWEIGLDTQNVDSPKIDRGLPYTKASYRSLDTIILHNKTEALEGVIVDTVRGAVGYRNHSVPVDLPLGGSWAEDLTWIEPVTECVDTNLTLEISLGSNIANITNVDLVDRGGFTNAPTKIPPAESKEDPQDPKLVFKAYQGALMVIQLLMLYFNVSRPANPNQRNTTIGRRFQLRSRYHPQLYGIALGKLLPDFLEISYSPDVGNHPNVSTSAQARLSVSISDWMDVQATCEGYATNSSELSNADINCGLLLGAPRPLHSDDPRIFQPFSKWTQSLFVCSSAIQASVKRVTFSINGTSALSSLQVKSVKDASYKDNRSIPVWAVEKTYKVMADARPVWGMIHSRFESSLDLHTWRATRFWLPATPLPLSAKIDSLASPAIFIYSMNDVYERLGSLGGRLGDLSDYTGAQSMALNRLWQSLSNSASTASTIIDLMFTEILATATVGTKSAADLLLDAKAQHNIVVIQYERRLEYNMLYAIPGLLVLLISVVFLCILSVCLVTSFSLKDVTQLANQLSTGRLITDLRHPDLCALGAETAEWCALAGDIEVRLPFTPRGDSPVKSESQSIVDSIGGSAHISAIVRRSVSQATTDSEPGSKDSRGLLAAISADQIDSEHSQIHREA